MKISPKSAQITFKYTPKNCIFCIKQYCQKLHILHQTVLPKTAYFASNSVAKNCIFYIKQCCLLILSGKAKKGIYHIQHINSYHSNLKNFMI